MINMDEEQKERIDACLSQVADVLDSHGLSMVFRTGDLLDNIKGGLFPCCGSQASNTVNIFALYERKSKNRTPKSKSKA